MNLSSVSLINLFLILKMRNHHRMQNHLNQFLFHRTEIGATLSQPAKSY